MKLYVPTFWDFSTEVAEFIMDNKDILGAVGIGVTFLVSVANFIYSLRSNRRTSFVNTVTTSRLKWIDSLRDKVSDFLAVTTRLSDPRLPPGEQTAASLLLQRDTLLHQIILHLNPRDPEDQEVRELADRVRKLTDESAPKAELAIGLDQLRDAAASYLKKEWDRVKKESTKGQS